MLRYRALKALLTAVVVGGFIYWAVTFVLPDPRERVWRTFSDIDTSEGALPYERVLGEEDYIEHITRSELSAGAGRSGQVGEATAYLFDARGLVEHARSVGSSGTSPPATSTGGKERRKSRPLV
ncbi:MAG: hypothetical protein M3P37_06385 [Actinomycetota bacterium]|nr:hypothetical protein [Actinomycetota bacterium]